MSLTCPTRYEDEKKEKSKKREEEEGKKKIRHQGVPNLVLPNGKPGVLAGLLRWPTLGAEYITLTTVEVIPSQWANTSKSRLPVICGGLSAPRQGGGPSEALYHGPRGLPHDDSKNFYSPYNYG
ncbi:hypothetical protein M0802_003981 [Mischocyttarus mexicanus]|nr:hypothetical protein M0802_003981 [Mischocyttarus mexicanus]